MFLKRLQMKKKSIESVIYWVQYIISQDVTGTQPVTIYDYLTKSTNLPKKKKPHLTRTDRVFRKLK